MRGASLLLAAALWLGCQGAELEMASDATGGDEGAVDAGADAAVDATPEVDDVPPTPDDGDLGCTADDECIDQLATLGPCEEARCDLELGTCFAAPRPDGSLCDDDDACTTLETCTDGLCAGATLDCNDSNPCTDDSCDPTDGCLHEPNTAPCDDGAFCTEPDNCDQGVCVGIVTAECYSGPCCGSNSSPGCEDETVAACVCAERPACCLLEGSWDPPCVALVETLGCATCPEPACGDDLCNGDETCSDCRKDCGACPGCGNGDCTTATGETCESCPEDCGACDVCGDGVCGHSEDCPSCPADCIDECGPAVCGDGACLPTESCTGCPADCGFCASCGDDTCAAGENCYSCPADCGDCPAGACGDGTCNGGEHCASCPVDCGICAAEPACGDGQCTAFVENCAICEDDCGACVPPCGNAVCETSEDCGSCPADCGGYCLGPCCEATAEPGCASPALEACVCGADMYCCDVEWDQVCVAQIAAVGCGSCVGSGCGDGVCGGGKETCLSCAVDCGTCSCGDGECSPGEDCAICPGDCGTCAPTCGDGLCNGQETCSSCELDCGECTTGDCCTPNSTPGCSDPSIESCVCAADYFCCMSSWDSWCVDEIEIYGCGTCY